MFKNSGHMFFTTFYIHFSLEKANLLQKPLAKRTVGKIKIDAKQIKSKLFGMKK